ncbi:efflux RND transporter periplasmic adaptor subunit [Actinobacillus equuli subsp. haemolyticus]|uniref:efflux RND transporter periplasmic adaptor subunit n=1 Tax=Actinobacillus equuli TaxID=718 RepID=UPI002442CDEB|nr:efflux RND transporter periplasmic adaptor subunit [Actinobacillus equuli]WGE82338.1 efflux RND transporter periplasmic adaptor subunit [Actinobacillus equuli subsp. haemolyticus]
MKLKPIITALVLAGIAAASYFSFSSSDEAQQVHYITEPVTRSTIDKSVLATGSVRASKRTEVGAQVSGKVINLYVTLGQTVKKGDLIADIDSSNQSNSLSTAEANLASYQAKLSSAKVALEVAQSNYTRLSKLYKQASASQSDLETAKNTLAAAKASVDEAKSQIKSAQISVADAKTNLNYTQIVSPMDGTIVSVPISVGQTVNSAQTSPTIVHVADLSKMLIKLEISEGDISQVAQGQDMTFTTLAEPNHKYHSKIDSVDPALTTLSDDSASNKYTEKAGNTEAIYYYANSLVDNSEQRLRIGMTVQGQVEIAKRENVLVVPTSALKKKGNETFIQVLENNQPIEKKVELGLADSQYTEITAGVTEGEQVITTQRADSEQIGFQPRSRGPF